MIHFYGDTHGRFDHVHALVARHRPAAIVFLGDLQARRPLEEELAPVLGLTDVWFIHGNHDTDSDADYDHVFGSTLAGRNLHGRVAEVAGMRIAGLGGVFRGQVWRPPDAPRHDTPEGILRHCAASERWRGGLPRKHHSTIFPADYHALESQQADILVSHEAPGVHRFGFSAIDMLARRMGVHTAFHGHQHEDIDYHPQRARLGFDAFGVGFRAVRDQHGRVVLAGQDDRARD